MWKAVQLPVASSTPSTPPPVSAPGPAPAEHTPAEDATLAAVQRCCDAYQRALADAGGIKASGAREAAERAFRRNLPCLIGYPSGREFMACVLRGQVLGIFWRDDGHRLIMEARAVLSAFPRDVGPCPNRDRMARQPGRPFK